MAKENIADVINLRILKWEDYSGLPGWDQCNQKDPYKREQESQSEA